MQSSNEQPNFEKKITRGECINRGRSRPWLWPGSCLRNFYIVSFGNGASQQNCHCFFPNHVSFVFFVSIAWVFVLYRSLQHFHSWLATFHLSLKQADFCLFYVIRKAEPALTNFQRSNKELADLQVEPLCSIFYT